jgi:uncharacterized membrane protein YagU involved in acid resistance
MTRTRAVLLGTLTVGTLDALDAFIFFGLRGVTPVRILQSIASGVLGRTAYQRGTGAALLGLALHFFIAFAIVITYVAAARLWPVLARRPWIVGPLYGIAVYLVMNLVVLPMSAAVVGTFPPPTASLANGVLIHMLGVGLPTALFARAATP